MRSFVFALLLVATAGVRPAVAHGKRHRRHAQPALRLGEPPPSAVELPPSFVAFHTARVMNDLILFHPDFPGLARTDDKLELTRQRDRLLLFSGERRTSDAAAVGIGLFGAMTVMAAHLP